MGRPERYLPAGVPRLGDELAARQPGGAVGVDVTSADAAKALKVRALPGKEKM